MARSKQPRKGSSANAAPSATPPVAPTVAPPVAPPAASTVAPHAASPKTALQLALLTALEQALRSARAAHQAAVEGATHAEARPENDKDTRGLEQSYLARGHAQRVADLEVGVAAVAAMAVRTFAATEPISLGALVTVEEEPGSRRFFVVPHGGGLVLPGEITVLTPTSPIGRALLGRRLHEDCEVSAGGQLRTMTVTAIE